MGLAVVTVAAGGMPVVDVTAIAPRSGVPVTEATNGRGVPVTKVVGKPGLPVVFETVGVAPGASAEATAFLARTSGLNAAHTNAYTALIDGLVADGVWSKLDMLHVYATQDSATARLNIVSTSYNGIINGVPTFTADRGYAGVNGSTTVYIDTGFSPSVAVATSKFQRNSAHVSIWSVVDVGMTTGGVIGHSNQGGGGNYQTTIHPRYTDGNVYMRINDTAPPSGGVTNATPVGHYLSNRSTSSASQGYKNGTGITTSVIASEPLVSANFTTLALNASATAPTGASHQLAMASIGASLTAGEVTSFYNRLRTYMTAVGVP